MSDDDCLFCRIVRGEIPSDKVHEDDELLAFRDVSPKAPTHILVIPKRHLTSLAHAEPGDAPLLGRLMTTAAEIARSEGIEEDGYRTVVNTGEGGGQSVFHLHLHLIGGRELSWPPG